MKILFNLMKCGLANNGGSSTLIKSANVLQDLGNEVIIIDSGKNNYTWSPLKVEHKIIKNLKDVPDADIILATGFKTVKSTLELPDRCGMKFHWIRAWETWQMSESSIIKRVLKVPTYKLVNSVGLYKKLIEYKIPSNIVYPGYDFDEIYPTDIPDRNSNEIIIGGLNASKKHWDTKRTNWIIEIAKKLKNDIPNIKLYMIGNDKNPNPNIVDKYYRRPSIEKKNEFYNSINLWLSPSCLEGLHIPPAEAMMTNCPVVGVDTELSGTKDYLFDGVNGLIAKNNFKSFYTFVESLIIDKQLLNSLGKNTRSNILNIGNRIDNMKIMQSIFKGMIL